MIGTMYCIFLEEVFPSLFQDVPLAIQRDMWFRDYVSPPGGILAGFLVSWLPRWIWRGRSQASPPRASDLNPLDFFMNETPVITTEDFISRIVAAEDKTQTAPLISESMHQSFLQRCQLYNKTWDLIFENLLWIFRKKIIFLCKFWYALFAFPTLL